MPGSWEMQNQHSVLCAILHTEHTSVAWAFGFRNLIIPGACMGLTGMPFDMARNAACMRALEVGATHIYFIDSDVVAPRDTILRLLAHNKPLISGVYCRRSPPHGVPVMLKNGKWVTDLPKNKIIDVDVCGAGCLLIRRDVLERMKPQRPDAGKHWFDWRVDCQGLLPPGECLSEDFTFNIAVKRQLGIPTLVDTSIQCRHVGLAEATFGNFVPCNADPNT